MDPDPGSYILILGYSPLLEAFTLFFSELGWYLLTILILIAVSAIMSGSEVAFFSLSKAEVDEYKEKNKVVWDLVQKPRQLLATILISNNLVNIGLVLVFAFAINKTSILFEWKAWTWLKPLLEVGVITFILLFFGEITPKVFANQRKEFFLKAFSKPLNILRIILYPVSWILVNSTQLIDKRFASKSEAASFEDIKHAIDLTSEEESPEEEKEILKGIVNFSSTAVKSIMTARVEVEALEINTPFEEVIENINEFNFSRIPVYEENLDKVKGILYAKDLLPLLKRGADGSDWQSLVRDPLFTPETKKIDDLLDEFKNKRLHIAVVVDEFGGTAGIVTLEDIIEEIFGEINDEFDNDDNVYSKLSESTYIFEGKLPLVDLVRIVGLDDNIFEEAKGDNDSLAGLILEIHGKIPKRGELIPHENFEFHIESVSQNRINRVKFVMNEPSPHEEASASS